MTVENVHDLRLLESRGRVCLIHGELEEAMRLSGEAIEMLQARGIVNNVGRLTSLRCEIYLAMGQPAQSLAICDTLNISELPFPLGADMRLVKIESHRLLGQFEEAAGAHVEFVELSDASREKSMELHRLNGQVFEVVQLEDKHDALVQRGIELSELQKEVDAMMDQVANDINGPLTTLKLVFQSIQAESDSINIESSVPTAATALERLKVLVADISLQSV